MKRITFSADESVIEQPRVVARSRNTTLNAAFREWLRCFTAQAANTQEFGALMGRLQHIKVGRRFSRDERNER